MHCIVMCTSLWQILTGGETKMFYCREDLSERGVDTELCKPLKLWWRAEELIRTEWTIQTRRTRSVMQKVSPRMTPLTRITGWVYKTSGGSKAVFLSTQLVITSLLAGPSQEACPNQLTSLYAHWKQEQWGTQDLPLWLEHFGIQGWFIFTVYR